MKIKAAGISQIGLVRNNNEDNLWIASQYLPLLHTDHTLPAESFPLEDEQTAPIYAVFDGMGGEQKGEYASYLAAKTLNNYYHLHNEAFRHAPTEWLEKATDAANAAICGFASENRVRTMGTTSAILGLTKENSYICNVGDSRVYCFQDGSLTQLSVDHTLSVPFFRSHALTQYLGIPKEEMLLEPEIKQLPLLSGQRYLLCSDGLTDMLSDHEICRVLHTVADTDSCLQTLLDKALEQGGADNITMILCDIQ